MDKIRLGRTELMVTACSFGALPVQRRGVEDSVKLLRKAYDGGINYFDTANMYTDSEMKLGLALSDVRHNIVISTKSGGKDKATVTAHIENSLRMLKTDYIDLFQFHNPAAMPMPDDENGPYAAALEAKKKGYIRHIGITKRFSALRSRENDILHGRTTELLDTLLTKYPADCIRYITFSASVRSYNTGNTIMEFK